LPPFLSVGYRITVMNMGARRDDEYRLSLLRDCYPDAHFVLDPTPEQAMGVIAASAYVIAGRYHAMVFARTARVPFYIPSNAPYKTKHEDLSSDPASAALHLVSLERFLATTKFRKRA